MLYSFGQHVANEVRTLSTFFMRDGECEIRGRQNAYLCHRYISFGKISFMNTWNYLRRRIIQQKITKFQHTLSINLIPH